MSWTWMNETRFLKLLSQVCDKQGIDYTVSITPDPERDAPLYIELRTDHTGDIRIEWSDVFHMSDFGLMQHLTYLLRRI